ncbi:aminopeptidase N [Streptomyces sp. NPDC003247]|uniref:aminopeptidase N n=1 Tax=Streptomyces sp. NPDC003247 TaxID=3364677 RepID=UPI0036A4096D
MPGTNLTQTEAEHRAALVTVESYEIGLDLTRGERTFGSTTTVRFSAVPGAATFIDLIAEGPVHEITLNGHRLDPAEVHADARISLSGLQAHNVLTVRADCPYSRTGEGLHRMVDPVDGGVYLYTQFEVADARRVFAHFEQPDLKASFRFTVVAPDEWTVFSNSPTPPPQPWGRGRSRWSFAPTERLPGYATALVAGDYHTVRQDFVTTDGTVVPMAVASRRSLASHLDTDEIFDITGRGIDYFQELFGHRYPFAKYDQIFVPEFNAGAMENAGCVTIGEHLVFRSKALDADHERRADTLLHELAHMWFGDLVTMRWWNDLWLNEAFASYASLRCMERTTRWHDAWTSFVTVRKNAAYHQDRLPSTHPVAATIRDLEDIYTNFDGITYAKGASVIGQLAAYIGDEAFLSGLRTYVARHAWGNATLTDLLDALRTASGRDLRAWSRAWLETAGADTLRPVAALDRQGRYASFEIVREAPADRPAPRSHRVAIGLYHQDTTGSLSLTRRIAADIDGPRTVVPRLIGEPPPDLVLVNDGDLTYTHLRFDDRSLRTLSAAGADFTAPLPRALTMGALTDMMENAEIRASDYVAVAMRTARRESDTEALRSLHRRVHSAIELFAAPSRRSRLAAEWAALAHSALLAAPPGSDAQVLWLDALCDTAENAEQLTFLTRLLRGHEALDGLPIDTGLRWSVLRRLAATGWAGGAEIDAEADRDPTADGLRYAAAARAAMPRAEAKAASWARMTGGESPSNEMLVALSRGFQQYGQEELLRPYAGEFFATISELWARRTPQMARLLAGGTTKTPGLYPITVVDHGVVVAVDTLLARDERSVPAGLRRTLSERRDGTRRALRARRLDATG